MDKEKTKYPAFMFYPMDFLTDDKMKHMTNEMVGMYIKLLAYDWVSDGLQDNDGLLLKLADFEWFNDDSTPKNNREKCIELLRYCFIPHPKRDGYITNPRLYEYKEKLKKTSKKQSYNGSKGGAGKHNKSQDKPKAKPNSSQTQAKPSYSVSSSVSSSVSNSKEKDLKHICAFFEEDWKKYPRKGNKKKAMGYYKKTVATPEKRKLFLETMDAYVKSVEEPKYLKHGETFFNQWEGLEIDTESKELSETEKTLAYIQQRREAKAKGVF